MQAGINCDTDILFEWLKPACSIQAMAPMSVELYTGCNAFAGATVLQPGRRLLQDAGEFMPHGRVALFVTASVATSPHLASSGVLYAVTVLYHACCNIPRKTRLQHGNSAATTAATRLHASHT